MAFSTAKHHHQQKQDLPEHIRACVFSERARDTTRDEKFPVFTKDLYLSVFPPHLNVKDRHVDDDKEADPNQFMKFMRHVGSGRLGKSYLATRVDFTPYAATKVLKQNPKLVVVMTMMDGKRVDYIDAVRAIIPFTFTGGEPSPFLAKVIFSFRSSLPYMYEYYYFVTEYWAQAVSLCHRLQQVGRMSENDTKFYVTELIEAVAYIHNRGKIIRRLSLCNILIDPEGHIKLIPHTMCDQNLDCGQACNMLVKNCGDQFYAAPEVVFGVDVQYVADWWSVGVITYQLLTGQLPFTGRTLGDLGKAITESPIPPSDCISGEAAAFLKQILHKDPRRRLGFSAFDSLMDPGTAEIREHPFFQGIHWKNVSNLLLLPPLVPRT
ncbi:unnamed protein product, partial [Candidula unifasciata]